MVSLPNLATQSGPSLFVSFCSKVKKSGPHPHSAIVLFIAGSCAKFGRPVRWPDVSRRALRTSARLKKYISDNAASPVAQPLFLPSIFFLCVCVCVFFYG